MRTHLPTLTLLSALVALACSTAPESDEGKSSLEARAEAILDKAREADPTLSTVLQRAAGYAVFPKVGKGAVGVGGAYGKGVLFENGRVVGYCSLTQGTVGIQLGGQTYAEIIAFENTAALNRFKSGNFAFNAQATAVALKSGAGANAKYADGVAVFTLAETGLMFEASIGGQKFSYEPKPERR
jgi:lipid-binding SYLF domain-containing protein